MTTSVRHRHVLTRCDGGCGRRPVWTHVPFGAEIEGVRLCGPCFSGRVKVRDGWLRLDELELASS